MLSSSSVPGRGRSRRVLGCVSGTSLCWQPVDPSDYRQQAEAFAEEMGREYYLHFAGHKEEFEIEPIYERHAGLFSREAIDGLRGEDVPELLEMAVEGHIGQSTKAEAAELARRETNAEIEVGGQKIPYRQARIAQANERDAE